MKPIAMPENFRPEIGETLFVSMYNQRPILVTITGYHNDARFSSEQFNYCIPTTNKSDSYSLNEARFYKGVPADSKYLYVAVSFESNFMEQTNDCEMEFFFDPESAFNYVNAVESGEIKPRLEVSAESVDYRVCIEKI